MPVDKMLRGGAIVYHICVCTYMRYICNRRNISQAWVEDQLGCKQVSFVHRLITMVHGLEKPYTYHYFQLCTVLDRMVPLTLYTALTLNATR